MFYQFYHDEWLEKLTDKEWRVYWQLVMLIHDRSEGGKITHSWHILSSLLGFRNRNMTLFRILKKLHDERKIIWENSEEFASRVPRELRNRLGVHQDMETSKLGTFSVWQFTKGGVIHDKVTLFSPQVLEMLKEEMSRIRGKFNSPYKPCCYYPECKFKRSIGECDRCSDPALARQRLEEALKGASD